VARRRPVFLTRAGIVIVMWAASIVPAASAHTLDVWRYLIPAVPMVGLLLSLFRRRTGRNDRMAYGGAIAFTRELSCAENASASLALDALAPSSFE